ncbi:MAG TPA: Gfo/Idh/MocA family oxidoreductase [Gaiellaceae bacterium]|nr:Gfo/Idh/MocA family oxidoreductase [Gaiellaceae bacterium]
MRVALVGCGNIARRYALSVAAYERLELAGATDLVPERAEEIVAEFGGTAYPSLEALLADDAVDTIVNLTVPARHAEVTAAALEAGKHVHTEKPVALRHDEASELAHLAVRRGLRLSCAPATLLGEAQQTAWKLIREGAVGPVCVAYAEANWGHIERWHPEPVGLYASGPLFDVGIYPLTILTGIFGPARRAVGYSAVIEPERVTVDGARFRIETPDFLVGMVELQSGAVVRLTATFWVEPSKQRGIEFHGERGAIHLVTWDAADARLELKPHGGKYEPVRLAREPHQGVDWARPVDDLAEAIEEGRPHRMSAEHAAHVVEVLNAIETSGRDGGPVDVRSSFELPAPLEWAL